ncbi:MAG: hypothetical protein J7513_04290 [Solirubrobacteraceae bacterium]|nr:hypothetical protein [Solirubrobacteraceae bacterium]
MVVRLRVSLFLSVIAAFAVISPGVRAAQFADLSAGGRTTCGTTAEGLLYCWGDGREGQLGRIGANSARHPVRVVGIYDAQQVAAGTNFGCTVLNRGSQINVQGIYACWGDGLSGQLGTGTFDRAQYPQQVRTPDGFTRIEVGSTSTCGIGAGGGVWCWGDDRVGQLGDGSAQPKLAAPIPVPGLSSGVTDLALGELHACAVRADKVPVCWGFVAEGRTGQPPTPDVAPIVYPTAVPGLSDIVDVAAGSVHTCALRGTDGTVWCFGQNVRGQLGSGVPVGAFSATPIQVPGITGATAIAAGGQSTCAVAGGRVWCWGDGQEGKLGNGSRADSNVPVAAAGLTDVAKITVGTNHACALTSKGAPFCWGANRYGQVGNGDVTGVNAREETPVRVTDYDLGRLTFIPRALQSFPTGTGGGVIEARGFIIRKTSSRYSCPKRGTIRISAKGKAAVRKVTFTRRSSTACRLSGSFLLPSKSDGATAVRYSVRGTHLRTASGRLRAQKAG